jgi:hypothetical protein
MADPDTPKKDPETAPDPEPDPSEDSPFRDAPMETFEGDDDTGKGIFLGDRKDD